jgi:hypothetical protein
MGLRIIQKTTVGRTRPVSEAEQLEALEKETERWSGLKNDANQSFQQEFIKNFRKVKARIDSPASVVEMAARIRQDILGRKSDSALSHGKVDIATLLELL